MIYVHYGANAYDDTKFHPIKNILYRNKPYGGLWASPVTAKNGWKQWCKREDFCSCDKKNSFTFKIKKLAKIYYISSHEDCMNMPQVVLDKGIILSDASYPDFEELVKQGYDIIHFDLTNDKSTDWHKNMYFTLYGWDCDCILVLNKDVIEVI